VVARISRLGHPPAPLWIFVLETILDVLDHLFAWIYAVFHEITNALKTDPVTGELIY